MWCVFLGEKGESKGRMGAEVRRCGVAPAVKWVKVREDGCGGAQMWGDSCGEMGESKGGWARRCADVVCLLR